MGGKVQMGASCFYCQGKESVERIEISSAEKEIFLKQDLAMYKKQKMILIIINN